MMNKEKAIEIAIEHLNRRSIKIIGIDSCKKISSEEIPNFPLGQNSDIWLVNLRRPKDVTTNSDSQFTQEEWAMLENIFKDNNIITVLVEPNGDTRVL